jgi:coenzyme F420-reducing hydrogenase alpha subunit
MSEPCDAVARSESEATGAVESIGDSAESVGPPCPGSEDPVIQPPGGPHRRRGKKPGRLSRQRSRSIRVDVLARVEGEGAFTVRVRRGAVAESSLRIYEPPRFFEALLRGRRFTEAPDITARICGICPIAYQMSAVQAMEAACGVAITGQLRALRRLLYCGEWIESHALHVHLLHAPDFLGYESSIHMARDHAAIVNRGLQLKKIGNEVVRLLGGREIHPVNVRVGGFYRVPERSEFAVLEERLKWALDAALQTVKWVSTFRFPPLERTYHYVALRHPSEYAVLSGEIVSSDGLNLPASRYEHSFTEHHVPRSTALHSTVANHGSYLVGPLARYNLNFDHLAPVAQNAAIDSGLGRTCHNPFKSIVVRSIETVQAIVDALEIIAAYERPERPFLDVEPRAATGHAATEAPRGLLYHRYRVSGDGTIEEAKIVPPTAQNQGVIEADLRAFVEQHLELDDRTLTWQCEQTVRNYDPCISCATHFLRLHLTRE